MDLSNYEIPIMNVTRQLFRALIDVKHFHCRRARVARSFEKIVKQKQWFTTSKLNLTFATLLHLIFMRGNEVCNASKPARKSIKDSWNTVTLLAYFETGFPLRSREVKLLQNFMFSGISQISTRQQNNTN